MNNKVTLPDLISLLTITFSALTMSAFAVSPPPDGGYPTWNTAEGEDALFGTQSGYNNTAIGYHAIYANGNRAYGTGVGALALTNGNPNTAVGYAALTASFGAWNTAVGYKALTSNTNGNGDTATGYQALASNVNGNDNTANGYNALFANTSGTYNTANGYQALNKNTEGHDNVATGARALFANTSGVYNTAEGAGALAANTTGWDNTAHGYHVLGANQAGQNNTAMGAFALARSKSGSDNTAFGFDALFNTSTGSNNIALGDSAGIDLTTGSNNITIGHRGFAGEANTIRIGTQNVQTATYVAGIYGTPVPGGITVRVNSDGLLGTAVSSERFKDHINPMEKASESVFSLKPVTFRYKKEFDPVGIPQFGLVAEEVAKVNPDLVVRDKGGKPYTVRYDAVDAMLLNEFLKEHAKLERLEATLADQQKSVQNVVAKFSAQLDEQDAEIVRLRAAATADQGN